MAVWGLWVTTWCLLSTYYVLSWAKYNILGEQIFIVFPGTRDKIGYKFLFLNRSYILIGWEEGMTVNKEDK